MKRIILIYVLLQIRFSCLSQSNETYVFSWNNEALQQVIAQIEQKTGSRFFYNPTDIDSVYVTMSEKEYGIEQLLENLSASTGLQMVYDDRGYVYLTRNVKIRTSLPAGFFDRVNDSVSYDVSVFDYIKTDEKKEDTSIENKLIEIGPRSNSLKPGKVNLAGYVKDVNSGEPVIGAQVYIENPLIGVATDQFGYYSISLPRGKYELNFKSIGMENTKRQIMLYESGKLNVEMEEDIIPLREVVIESEKDVNVSGMQMGLEKIDIKTIKQIPTALGEMDILKVALTLPGVQTVGESATGLNVRGGATDQNLILFNDMVIYNPAHLFGFFSAFNP
ncbi:MAG: carboxypeptidase-like regulatory domain-containing protein, partial [Cyclobacteriaceae bacterium]